MTQSRKDLDRKAELALAETLRESRAEVAKHVEVGEGARVPRSVTYMVEDILDVLDSAVEELTADRDQEIDDAIGDFHE
jgi:hypothetical protein